MPSWSAFNSLVTDEDVPEKIVGFLPGLPYPVTEYETVYKALKNTNGCIFYLNDPLILSTVLFDLLNICT